MIIKGKTILAIIIAAVYFCLCFFSALLGWDIQFTICSILTLIVIHECKLFYQILIVVLPFYVLYAGFLLYDLNNENANILVFPIPFTPLIVLICRQLILKIKLKTGVYLAYSIIGFILHFLYCNLFILFFINQSNRPISFENEQDSGFI